MIIAAITGPTPEDARKQLRLSSRYAQMVEFRLDLIAGGAVKDLTRGCRKPWIATCRPVREGGKHTGDERGRLGRLLDAAKAGAAFVDIELDAIRDFRALLGSQHVRTRLIVSRHAFDRPLPDFSRTYRALRAARADVVKLSFMADDAWQLSLVREFLELARRDRQHAIATAMGAAGEASRILYKVLGGWATYAAPERGDPSAPGQVSARILNTVYHAHERSRRTRVFGLVGNPVGQSKGVYIHNPLYRSAGFDGVYVRFPVVDTAQFMKKVGPLLSGCSVTLPHKQEMMRYCASRSPEAASIGAANTLVRRRGQWYGANTDANAALESIERRMKVAGKRLVIVGAGGAARAIAAEAKQRGAEVVIVNRSDAHARTLAGELGVGWAPLGQLKDVNPGILVNATPVGMWPDVRSTPVDAIPGTVRLLFDAIYNPPMTRFLTMGREKGLDVITGVEMYAHQAVEQIRLLTGIRVSAAQVRRRFEIASAMTATGSGKVHA